MAMWGRREGIEDPTLDTATDSSYDDTDSDPPPPRRHLARSALSRSPATRRRSSSDAGTQTTEGMGVGGGGGGGGMEPYDGEGEGEAPYVHRYPCPPQDAAGPRPPYPLGHVGRPDRHGSPTFHSPYPFWGPPVPQYLPKPPLGPYADPTDYFEPARGHWGSPIPLAPVPRPYFSMEDLPDPL